VTLPKVGDWIVILDDEPALRARRGMDSTYRSRVGELGHVREVDPGCHVGLHVCVAGRHWVATWRDPTPEELASHQLALQETAL
jgi:hypothetical protein